MYYAYEQHINHKAPGNPFVNDIYVMLREISKISADTYITENRISGKLRYLSRLSRKGMKEGYFCLLKHILLMMKNSAM